jgi:2'-5' RNA ligase
MSMGRIAVDIVLLPDEEMAELTIEANARLVRQYGSQIVLSQADCLPHISLAMGCVEPDRIEAIGEILKETAGEHPIGDLVVTGVVTTLDAKGQRTSSFALAKTPELQSLHEDITGRMREYFSYDATAEMIYGSGPVAESTLAWIRTFREKSSFAAFFPHITLGYGPVDQPMTFPLRVTPRCLALCHLGNHCTCRKVLAGVNL